jgi:hypothetical protein
MTDDTLNDRFQKGSESIWRHIITFLAWAAWLGALAVFAYATVHYNPNEGNFAPQWVGFTFIALIGVGIAAGNTKAKHNLSDTIVAAFRAGMDAQSEMMDERTELIIQSHDNGIERPNA